MRALLLLWVLVGCAPKQAAPVSATATWVATEGVVLAGQGAVQVRTELVFGLTRPNQLPITEAEWAEFVREQVRSRLPGYAILPAQGVFTNEHGDKIDEPARVIVYVHPPSRDEDRIIDAIRAAYLARFEQESVLRIDSPAIVSF